jgi:radical SAM superfamily enzyme YgiQ (UPF0313 family)
LEDISRPYSRYGIDPALLEDDLKRIPDPGAILITSLMTYWYPGVFEAVRVAKNAHPTTPVILGGLYARLCTDHALKFSGADMVVPEKDFHVVFRVLQDLGIQPQEPPPASALKSYPAFDLLSKTEYICILTSQGCPYRCAYCASAYLNDHFEQKTPAETADEIVYWHTRYGIRDFAFYDDALLVSSQEHIEEMLKRINKLRLGLRFHTPNAIHAREVTQEIARLMWQTGFCTLRLGLETADFAFRENLDNKVAAGEFERAVRYFKEAGFSANQIGAYVLVGLPEQSVASVSDTIRLVNQSGAIPFLAEYSPIPQTALWEKAVRSSRYDLPSEPLFHNNTLLPCWNNEKSELPRLKRRVAEIRRESRGF